MRKERPGGCADSMGSPKLEVGSGVNAREGSEGDYMMKVEATSNCRRSMMTEVAGRSDRRKARDSADALFLVSDEFSMG